MPAKDRKPVHPTWVEIDLDALAYNFHMVKSIIGRRVQIAGIVKSNAYGHGMVEVSRKLKELGMDMLAVCFVEEGITIRQAGIKGIPILILGGFQPGQGELLVQYDLTPAIYDDHMIEELATIAGKHQTVIPCHLKVDTGLGRLGVHYSEAADFAATMASHKEFKLEGVFSHLSFEEPEHEFTYLQIKRFRHILSQLQARRLSLRHHHLASSAGVLGYPSSWFNMVRPGAILYGSYPAGYSQPYLKQVLSLKTTIMCLKKFPPHTPISYESSYITQRESLIAILPIGYGDGFSRLYSSVNYLLWQGKKVPIVGKICMNFTLVDVTDFTGVKPGDEVVIIGECQGKCLRAADFADPLDILPEEVLCNIDKSLPRLIVEKNKT